MRQELVTRIAATGEVIGLGTYISAYVRVGDLITVFTPRTGTSTDELRRLATTTAGRLCTASATGC